MDNVCELVQQLVNSVLLAIVVLKEIYCIISEMSVEEVYRYICSGVLKYYLSVLYLEDVIEGLLVFVEKCDLVWKGC